MSNKMAKIYDFIKEFRSFTLGGFLKFLALKMRGKTILVKGTCLGCGACCKSISLEGRSGWLRSKKEFLRIVGKYPEYRRFSIIGKDRQGILLFTCDWSTPDGTCTDYENRLPLCKNFPEGTLAFAGGALLATCGYSFVEGVPFDKILQRELKKIK